MAVSKSLRFQILRRDNHACRYCGAVATPEKPLTVDHVVPVAHGGSDAPENLAAACRDCNAGKSATPADASMVADVAQDALRWAAAIKQATETALADRDHLMDIERAVHDVFAGIPVPSYKGGGEAVDYFPGDWFRSIHKFVAAGLAKGELIDAALIAISSRSPKPERPWSYFCGICWNMVTDRQNAARAILAVPEPTPTLEETLTGEDLYALTSYVHLSTVCDNR